MDSNMELMDGRLELTDLAVLLRRQGMPIGQLPILSNLY
jgi:hypothetical protein